MMTAVASQRRIRLWGGLLALCLLLVGLLLTLPAWAQQALPRIDSLLTDEAGVLSMAERSEIGQRLTDIERRLGSQVLVLTVPTTAPESIEQYSLRVVENTPAGRKGIDDGVLILLAMKDRRMRIEVGYGLEGALPDAVAARIIRDQMTPHMRAGNVAAALTAAIEAVAARIAGEELPVPAAAPAPRGVIVKGADGREQVDGFDLRNFLIVALFMSFVLSRVAVRALGRFSGAVLTGGLIGLGAWLFTASIFLGVMAMFAGLIFVLLFGGGGGGGGSSSGGGWSSSRRRRRGGGVIVWPSGGGWSTGGGWSSDDSSSGGGWSSGGGGGGWSGGGGGGFGGGGASGSW